MNRIEREIVSKKEIIDILDRCDTIRLGLFMENYPYIVPISFGCDVEDEEITIYFHGAIKGQKNDCINKNNQVCIESDIFYKVEPTEIGITSRYESIIGFGHIEKVEENEKIYGLRKIVEHYKVPN